MSGIHNAILVHVRDRLIRDLIANIDDADTARAGAVKIGPLQGDPAPDTGRITVTVHENDPDNIVGGAVTGLKDGLADEIEMIEIGGAATTARMFTVKARCLFSTTREDEDTARAIASTVRDRIEVSLLRLSFSGITSTSGEYVARNIPSTDIQGEMVQAGGPPDAFDYLIKLHFSVLTTRIGAIPS